MYTHLYKINLYVHQTKDSQTTLPVDVRRYSLYHSIPHTTPQQTTPRPTPTPTSPRRDKCTGKIYFHGLVRGPRVFRQIKINTGNIINVLCQYQFMQHLIAVVRDHRIKRGRQQFLHFCTNKFIDVAHEPRRHVLNHPAHGTVQCFRDVQSTKLPRGIRCDLRHGLVGSHVQQNVDTCVDQGTTHVATAMKDVF